MTLSPAQAAKALLKIKEAEDSFLGFVKALHPDFKLAPFQLDLIDKLDKLEKGELLNGAGQSARRLLINMPPRHGKSWLATTLFPIYYLGKKPRREVLSTSYSADLAKGFGRQCRNNAEEPVVRQIFPDFKMSDSSRAVDDWRTTSGGGYYATGIGGGTPGRAANLLIVDDPIKAREEAESPTYRNKTWSYYISSLIKRMQPEVDGTPPIEIMILTRWHPMDPAGRLMETEDWAEGDWVHVQYRGIEVVETKERILRSHLDPADERYIPSSEIPKYSNAKRHIRATKEEALWPERFPLEWLHKQKRIDEREFAALYQQSPYIIGGNIIKSTWWQIYKEDEVPKFTTVMIAADTAFKKTETADYSVLLVAALATDGDIYLLDLIRDRYDFPELKKRSILLNNQWRGRGLKGLYIEDKASGQSLIQELKKESGVSVIPYKVSSDKVSRINAVTPLIEGGRVFIPEQADWLDEFINETQAFPAAAHDDQCDALSIALDVLSRTSLTADLAFSAPLGQTGKSLLTLMKDERQPRSYLGSM